MTSHRPSRRRPSRLLGVVLGGVVLGAALGAAPGTATASASASCVAPPAGAAVGTDRGLVEMTVCRSSGVVSAWLGNGVRVHHRRMTGPDGKQRDPGAPREPRVQITIALAGGELHETGPTRGLSAAATVAWRTPATRSMDAGAMAAHLRAHRIEVGGYAAGDAMVLRVESPASELGPALGVAAALLTEPVVDEGALAKWAAAHAEKLGSSPTSPRWVVSAALREALQPAPEARLRPLTAEQIRGIDAGAAQAWLDRIVSSPAAPIEAAMVGDIPVAEALRLAEAALGTLPPRERISPGTLSDLRAPGHAPGPVAIRVRRRLAAAKALAGAGFLGTDTIDLRAHRALSLAAQVLDERVTVRIRERGWGGISDILTTALPGGFSPGEPGVVHAVAMVEPRRADDAAELIETVIAELAAGGPTPDEFRRARAALIRDVRRTLASPHYWSAVLAQSTYRGSTPAELAAAVEVIEGFTMDDITAALREHATPGRSIHIIISPSEGR